MSGFWDLPAYRIWGVNWEWRLITEHDLAQVALRIESAVAAAGDADMLRLYRKAAYLLPGTGLNDSEELFNEAIVRTLEGTRQWPADVSFEAYIWMVMKSIADGERNLSHRTNELLANDMASTGDEPQEDLINGFGDAALAVENVLIDQDAQQKMVADLETIENHFKGDEAVTLVIMALEDGIPPRDLASDYGMSSTQYESARKKLRRGVDRLFPGRRKA